jgi:hypothetical protein
LVGCREARLLAEQALNEVVDTGGAGHVSSMTTTSGGRGGHEAALWTTGRPDMSVDGSMPGHVTFSSTDDGRRTTDDGGERPDAVHSTS